MILTYIKLVLCVVRFRTYTPIKVNIRRGLAWLYQFPPAARRDVVSLLGHVDYVTESATRECLTTLNRRLLTRLKKDGIGPESVIYIQVDEAGSSSPVMLNLLRDSQGLTQLNCNFVDSKDKTEIGKLTYAIGTGAIVFVDDFAGTGDQLTENIERIRDYYSGSFSEFFIAPRVCQEAMHAISNLGVEPLTTKVHMKSDRPLHDECDILSLESRAILRDVGEAIDPDCCLGYGDLATMVVYWRTTPDSTPLILRGSIGQEPYMGLLPRSDDLNPPERLQALALQA